MPTFSRKWFSFERKCFATRIAVACSLLCLSLPASSAEAVAILNDSTADLSLSRVDIRNIFTARTQYWPDGSKITVFVMAAQAEAHRDFCRDVLKMFPYQLERQWNLITYSGQGERPQVVDSEAALIESVEKTPGAIGYAYKGMEMKNVREVAVQ